MATMELSKAGARQTSEQIIERLFAAAGNHAEDAGECDHAVGDLQDLLRAAWNVMTASQKLAFLASDGVSNVIDAGARGEFDADALQGALTSELQAIEQEITEAGYVILEGETGFHWETVDDVSESFKTREDAVENAHRDHAAAALDNQE